MGKFTIVINEYGKRKKIAKIITEKDGSFALFSPYHVANYGYFMKCKLDYSKKEMSIPDDEIIEEYTASNQAKLSLHTDGFVHFSSVRGNNIRSGKNQETGEPKGLGYHSNPLTKPVLSGPTTGLSIWGLDDYEDFDRLSKGSVLLEFNHDEIYQLYPLKNCNGYGIHVFVFPDYMWRAVFEKDGILRIDVSYNFENTPSTFNMRVIPLDKINSFLGILVGRMSLNFPSQSGYILNAPGSLRPKSSDITEVMHAFYPKFISRQIVGTLDYNTFK